MGYVPGRRYEGVRGLLGPNGLSITLNSGGEDAWFFEHLWLKENRVASFKTSERGVDGILTIRQPAIYSNVEHTIDGLTVEISAEGLVMVGKANSPEDAEVLSHASGKPAIDGKHIALYFE